MSVIIYGPQGCGKTRNAEALRKAFGCDEVVDGWEPGHPVERGNLHLTWHHRPSAPGAGRVQIMSFDEAMKQVSEASA